MRLHLDRQKKYLHPPDEPLHNSQGELCVEGGRITAIISDGFYEHVVAMLELCLDHEGVILRTFCGRSRINLCEIATVLSAIP